MDRDAKPHSSASYLGKPSLAQAQFTLIELLVVVAIIAILAAMLLPALGRAKERGKRTLCASNMHNFQLAMAMYADDNDAYYPNPLRNPLNGNGIYEGFPQALPASTYNELKNYLGDVRVLACPNLDQPEPSYAPQYDSYHMGIGNLAGHPTPAGSAWQSPMSTSDSGYLALATDMSLMAQSWAGFATHTGHGYQQGTPNVSPLYFPGFGNNVATNDGSVNWRDGASMVQYEVYYQRHAGSTISGWAPAPWKVFMYW